MTTSAYEQILAVQSLDIRLVQLRYRIEHHPIKVELATVEAAITAVRERLAEVEGRRHEIERAQKRLSDEVASIEARRLGIETKLYDGSVQATKELLTLQEESAKLLQRQTGIEDDQLEGMEQMEEVGAEVETVEAELATLVAQSGATGERLAEAVRDLEAEIAAAIVERTEAVAAANPELLASYEALAPQFDSAPLARFVDGRCDGCHMQLSAVAADQLQKAPEMAVVNCEECGRLLVR